MPRDVGVLGAELLHQKLLGVWDGVKYTPVWWSVLEGNTTF